MKRLLHVFVLLLSCVSIMKAEQLVATLQSGDATKAFYGYSALKDAYNEASDGDIITLSKGNFDTVDIEKRITLRGAGAFVKGESTSLVNLNVSADYAVIEGIYVTNVLFLKGHNQQLLRCYVDILNSAGRIAEDNEFDPLTFDAYIADCAIKTDGHAFCCVNATYKNCAIDGQAGNICSEGSATYDQCIVRITGRAVSTNAGMRCGMYRYGYFYNCILHRRGADSSCDYSGLRILTPNQFYNTVIYSIYNIEFETGIQRENCVTKKISPDEYDNKFGTGSSYSNKFPYFFYEDVTASYVNSAFVCGVVDHKEWPAIPRVIESNIDKETDASGHLKVEVKVSCER